MTAETILAEASKLSVAERLLVVEQIWETIAAEEGDLPLSAEQRAELDLRLDDDTQNPNEGATWQEVEARIRAKSW